MQMLYPRADWRIAKNYPQKKDVNATMWAWEFLRRNLTYQAMFDRIQQASYENDMQREEEETRLAVAWNLSKLLDPRFSYQELEQQHDKPLEDFYFIGQQPEVVLPIFDSDDIYMHQEDELSQQMNTPIIACSEQSVYLAPNEAMLRVCLDGDIEFQINRFRAWLNESHEIQSADGANEKHQIRRLRAYNIQTANGNNKDVTLKSFYLLAEQKKVHYSHLWYALRIMDAIGAELLKIAKEGHADELDATALDEMEEMIRSTLNGEHGKYSDIKPMKKSKFNAYKAFGYWYALSKRYVALAHANLEGQIKKKRSNNKKST